LFMECTIHGHIKSDKYFPFAWISGQSH
jgi:hypothetical protein